MMNVKEELKSARKEGYAIGAFNTSNMEMTKAICAAVRDLDAKAIIQTTPSAIKYAGLKQLYDIVINEIQATGIRATIHLDHGKDIQMVRECINIGYGSVMFDGSILSLEDNIRFTRQIVEMAHDKGASVEGEIGVINNKDQKITTKTSGLSNPEQTAEFVKKTGVDSIAVAIGNQHGAPSHERIDLDLLKEIAEVVKIPIVLHGSSGLSNFQTREAIRLGVAKINVDTRLRQAFTDGLRFIDHDESDYRAILTMSMHEVKAAVKDRINLFSRR